jgi:hypothetical protein
VCVCVCVCVCACVCMCDCVCACASVRQVSAPYNAHVASSLEALRRVRADHVPFAQVRPPLERRMFALPCQRHIAWLHCHIASHRSASQYVAPPLCLTFWAQRQFLKAREHTARTDGLDLASLLILPVQHAPRWVSEHSVRQHRSTCAVQCSTPPWCVPWERSEYHPVPRSPRAPIATACIEIGWPLLPHISLFRCQLSAISGTEQCELFINCGERREHNHKTNQPSIHL